MHHNGQNETGHEKLASEMMRVFYFYCIINGNE